MKLIKYLLSVYNQNLSKLGVSDCFERQSSNTTAAAPLNLTSLGCLSSGLLIEKTALCTVFLKG